MQGIVFGNARLTTVLQVAVTMEATRMKLLQPGLDGYLAWAHIGTHLAVLFLIISVTFSSEQLRMAEAALEARPLDESGSPAQQFVFTGVDAGRMQCIKVSKQVQMHYNIFLW